jgi:hypothetical protein
MVPLPVPVKAEADEILIVKKKIQYPEAHE